MFRNVPKQGLVPQFPSSQITMKIDFVLLVHYQRYLFIILAWIQITFYWIHSEYPSECCSWAETPILTDWSPKLHWLKPQK